MWGHGSHSAIVNGSYGASKDLGFRAVLDLKARCCSREDLMDESSGLKAHRKLRVQDPECRLQRLAFVEFRAYDARAVEFAEAVQPQTLKNPLYSSLQTRLPPPPPCHGGWPSPARPSRMKFQPRPRFEALAVRGGRIFRSKVFLQVFGGFGGPSTSLDPPKAPGRPWSPLDAPGAPWRPLQGPGALKPRANPPHAWMKRSNLYRP